MATLMNQLMFISFFLFFGLLSARLCLKSFVLAQQISALIRVELWVSLSLGLNYIIDPPPRAAPPFPCDPSKLELAGGFRRAGNPSPNTGVKRFSAFQVIKLLTVACSVIVWQLKHTRIHVHIHTHTLTASHRRLKVSKVQSFYICFSILFEDFYEPRERPPKKENVFQSQFPLFSVLYTLFSILRSQFTVTAINLLTTVHPIPCSLARSLSLPLCSLHLMH